MFRKPKPSLHGKPRFEQRRPSDLVAYANNARHHPEQQLRLLEKAILAFGFVVPVLIDEHNGIIAGHARVRAALNLRLEWVPCMCLGQLSDAKLKALRLFDNRIAQYAVWDKKALQREFAEILEVDNEFDLELTGFPAAEIDFTCSLDGAAGGADPDDAFEEVAGAPISREGDLWTLGLHRIGCFSSFGPGVVATLQGETAEVVIADLPALRCQGSNEPQSQEGAPDRVGVTSAQSGRAISPASFLGKLAQASVAGSTHFLFGGWPDMGALLKAIEGSEFRLSDVCVVVAPSPTAGGLYRSDLTPVCVLRRGGPAESGGRRRRPRTSLWRYPTGDPRTAGRGKVSLAVPPGRPVALVADAIEDASTRDGLILDPSLGSGTTLLAAERTGRRLAGVEADPKLVDVAIRRWQRRTGRKAVHATTNLSFAEVERLRGEGTVVQASMEASHG